MSVRANINPLSWDSEFFSFPIAKLTEINGPGTPSLMSDDFNDYQLVQAKIPASDYFVLSGLQALGFQLVDGEIDLEIAVPLKNIEQHSRLEVATKKDIPYLKNLAGHAFELSRFRAPWFNTSDNGRFYGEWAEKAVLGTFDDCCLIIKDSMQVIKGFVTLKQSGDGSFRVGLLAVSPDYRKQGVGDALVNGALAYCRNQDAGSLHIATQTGNIAALRLYIKYGATIASSSYWLYRSTK